MSNRSSGLADSLVKHTVTCLLPMSYGQRHRCESGFRWFYHHTGRMLTHSGINDWSLVSGCTESTTREDRCVLVRVHARGRS